MPDPGGPGPVPGLKQEPFGLAGSFSPVTGVRYAGLALPLAAPWPRAALPGTEGPPSRGVVAVQSHVAEPARIESVIEAAWVAAGSDPVVGTRRMVPPVRAGLPDDAPVLPGGVEAAPLPVRLVLTDLTQEVGERAVRVRLDRVGLLVSAVEVRPFDIRRDHVRYYHAEDAGRARRAAKRAGVVTWLAAVERDRRPEPGTVELWLEGEGSRALSHPVLKDWEAPNVLHELQPRVVRPGARIAFPQSG